MNTRKYIEALFYKMGSTGLVRRLMKKYHGKIVMLCYHRVAPEEELARGFTPVHLNTVSVRRFEDQIRYLTGKYQLIAIQEVSDRLSENSGERCAAVTIDDGYKDTIEYALPVLEKYNAPAVVYINTCFPDGAGEVWSHEIVDIINAGEAISFNYKGEQYHWQLSNEENRKKCFSELTQLISSSARNRQDVMSLLRGGLHREGRSMKYALSWDEIRELDAHPLITIGAHTHNHLSLAGLARGEAEYEMLHSRKRLEEELGHEIEHFAYPFGGPAHAGEREFRIAETCGFRSAVTVRNAGVHREHLNKLFALPRYAVSERDTLTRLKAKLSGWEAFARHKGRVVVV